MTQASAKSTQSACKRSLVLNTDGAFVLENNFVICLNPIHIVYLGGTGWEGNTKKGKIQNFKLILSQTESLFEI